jgi:hypothetical protein
MPGGRRHGEQAAARWSPPGRMVPVPPRWFSNRARANRHMPDDGMSSPGGVYAWSGRAACGHIEPARGPGPPGGSVSA